MSMKFVTVLKFQFNVGTQNKDTFWYYFCDGTVVFKRI